MPQPRVVKQRIQVVFVDPPNRRIDGMLKDRSIIQVSVWETSTFFRWPVEGELWTIQQESGVWMLGSRMDTTMEDTPVEALNPGEARIHVTGPITIAGGDQSYTLPRKFTKTFGNGSATVFSFAHGLNTLDVHYSVRTIAAPYTSLVEGAVYSATRPDSNTLRLTFTSAPAVNGLVVTIMG